MCDDRGNSHLGERVVWCLPILAHLAAPAHVRHGVDHASVEVRQNEFMEARVQAHAVTAVPARMVVIPYR